MQSKYIKYSSDEFCSNVLPTDKSDSMQLTCDDSLEQQQTFIFAAKFTGRMDMYSNLETVATYLNAHEDWFYRCAQPMTVLPLGENGYVLTVGKYGSFGYEVEPKIGVVLSPPVDRVYQMQTIPIPDYETPGYDVNYLASMELKEVLGHQDVAKKGIFNQQPAISKCITQVNWSLDLSVEVKFPKFMAKLSPALIQTTGDRLLAQIIRQVSPRLTYKVQEDFHGSQNLPIPSKSSRQLNKVNKS